MKNIHVTLRVEIPIKDVWGDSCTLGSVRKDAIEEAKRKLNLCIKDTHINIVEDVKNKVIIVT